MQNNVFGTERISKLLLRLAPPIMFSQLIQAMYNIIDSYFVGQYSTEGLAALSVLFPNYRNYHCRNGTYSLFC